MVCQLFMKDLRTDFGGNKKKPQDYLVCACVDVMAESHYAMYLIHDEYQ